MKIQNKLECLLIIAKISGLYYKSFTIVSYDRNDRTITIKLYYDRKASVVAS